MPPRGTRQFGLRPHRADVGFAGPSCRTCRKCSQVCGAPAAAPMTLALLAASPAARDGSSVDLAPVSPLPCLLGADVLGSGLAAADLLGAGPLGSGPLEG